MNIKSIEFSALLLILLLLSLLLLLLLLLLIIIITKSLIGLSLNCYITITGKKNLTAKQVRWRFFLGGSGVGGGKGGKSCSADADADAGAGADNRPSFSQAHRPARYRAGGADMGDPWPPRLPSGTALPGRYKWGGGVCTYKEQVCRAEHTTHTTLHIEAPHAD